MVEASHQAWQLKEQAFENPPQLEVCLLWQRPVESAGVKVSAEWTPFGVEDENYSNWASETVAL